MVRAACEWAHFAESTPQSEPATDNLEFNLTPHPADETVRLSRNSVNFIS